MHTLSSTTPLLGFCAFGSGIGKTTLLKQLIPQLTAQGLRLSVVKHAHHSFDIDHAGKDSYELREAGAVQMMLGSKHRWALITELSRMPKMPADEPSLSELLCHIDHDAVDLILVEGFKHEKIPKIEIYRPVLGKPLLAESDTHIIAVASDGEANTQLPILDLNDIEAVAQFILAWLKNHNTTKPRL